MKEHSNYEFSGVLYIFQLRLERLLAGTTKPAKNVLDDLLSSNEGGKHDYDWLLTPPETSPHASTNGKESQPKLVAPRRNSSVRSGSTNTTSRLFVSQSESNHLSRPARSSSVTRSSIATTQNTSRNSNILNTSSASVSSYIRPSTPTNRSTSAARPSTRTTPSRSRPSSTSIDRITRPSTPTPRPQSPTVRPASRPSTPTRRNPTSFNKRSVGPTSRPNSPISRVRTSPQPINHPDFPNETPPNLRTSLPQRPVSAGRSRPGAALIVKGNVENTNTRRPSSPIVARQRVADPPGQGRSHADGHAVESTTRKPIKVLSSENGTGFGRSISKKSLNMAIKHLDIRAGGARPLSGSTLFPHSIRSNHGSSANNNVNSKNATFNNGYSDNRVKPKSIENKSPYSSKLTHVDIYESLRYDSILLKEDLKNTSWLHSADEKSDQSPLFDNGFESLPEPFAPL
ncbi:hypothetical protein M8C21_033472 [Ambrosia artemisiifolia]|uniref:Uncharacterized protein n=1 Tax=Ambrosia artemisiifolia TaxID=4212 RepID=A0AAD5CSB4_AMBAR|nr:hypothetical protein M8C21_033472 [Ambrosia artemisiifolia]